MSRVIARRGGSEILDIIFVLCTPDMYIGGRASEALGSIEMAMHT